MILMENKGMKLLITILCLFISLATFGFTPEGAKKPVVPAASSLPSKVCNQETLNEFKYRYAALQNALKYDGQDVVFDPKKTNLTINAAGISTLNIGETSGKKVEQQLYQQYKNALIKVGKIYQQLSKLNGNLDDESKKLLGENPEITKFFAAIDPANGGNPKADVDMEKLLTSLQKVKIPGFEISNEDKYLLSKLMIHSQDRICTLDGYNKATAASSGNRDKIAYLEQLRKSPLNKLIESLKTIKGTDDLQITNQEEAINQAVKENLEKMRKLLRDNAACAAALATHPNILGEPIQSCNYAHFIRSITADDANFNQIESILHFINANQKADAGHTSLEWINQQLQNVAQVKCSFDPSSKELIVQNLQMNGNSFDTSKFSCTMNTLKPKVLNGDNCRAQLNFEYVDGTGIKISPKKSKNNEAVAKLSIAGASGCNEVALKNITAAPQVPQQDKSADDCKKEGDAANPKKVLVPSEDKKSCVEKADKTADDCKKEGDASDPKKILVPSEDKKSCIEGKPDKSADDCKKEGDAANPKVEMIPSEDKKSCIAKPTLSKQDQCTADNDKWMKDHVDPETGRADSRYIWDTSVTPPVCKDKQKKADDSSGDAPPTDDKPAPVYPNKPVPGRFQPVQIPTRQIYILPGMP